MPLGVGMLGYGSIGKLHALAYRSIPGIYPSLPRYVMAAVCTSSTETADAAAREGGFIRAYADMRALVADPDVHVIDIVLPNYAHKEAILLALGAGKHVTCEKPLALSGAEAREIAAAAARSRSRLGMTFNYRFAPALAKARALVEAGALGEIYGFHSEYLHGGYQDASRPLTWRMRFESSGGGAIVDLGSHVIDLIRWLLGEIAEVFAETKTYIAQRPLKKGGASSAASPSTTPPGRSSAWPRGLSAASSSRASPPVRPTTSASGSKAPRGPCASTSWTPTGSTSTTRHAPPPQAGWVRLETISSFPGASVPPARAILGWERLHVESQYRFLKAIFEDRDPSPGLADGVANHLVIDALYSSARSGHWEKVDAL